MRFAAIKSLWATLLLLDPIVAGENPATSASKGDEKVDPLHHHLARQSVDTRRRILQLKVQHDLLDKWWQKEGSATQRWRSSRQAGPFVEERRNRMHRWPATSYPESGPMAEHIHQHGFNLQEFVRFAHEMPDSMTPDEAKVFRQELNTNQFRWDWARIQKRYAWPYQLKRAMIALHDPLGAVDAYRKYGFSSKADYYHDAKYLCRGVDLGDFTRLKGYAKKYGKATFTNILLDSPRQPERAMLYAEDALTEQQLAYVAAYDYARLIKPKAMAEQDLPDFIGRYPHSWPGRDDIRKEIEDSMPKFLGRNGAPPTLAASSSQKSS